MATFRIGRKFFGKGTNEEMLQKMTDALEAQIINSAIGDARVDGYKVAAAMQKAGLKEILKLGPFIGSDLIGLGGKTGGEFTVPESAFSRGLGDSTYDTLSPFANKSGVLNVNRAFPRGARSLKWKELSLRQQKKKQHGQFFLDSGALREYFKDSSGDILNGIGEPKVEFKPKNKGTSVVTGRTIFGSLVISLAPKLSTGSLKQLQAGNWAAQASSSQTLEKRLFPTEVSKKLFGARSGPQRPLFQPALAFWLLYRVPIVISRAMSKSINDIQRGQNAFAKRRNSAGETSALRI